MSSSSSGRGNDSRRIANTTAQESFSAAHISVEFPVSVTAELLVPRAESVTKAQTRYGESTPDTKEEGLAQKTINGDERERPIVGARQSS